MAKAGLIAATATRTRLDANQRRLAIGLVLGVTLVAFEMTAVITALPTITDELGGDSLYGVALAAYTLANLVALVAAGGVADRKGPTLPFVVSIGTFIGGLVVTGTATSMAVVVIGRALQGAGAGGIAPVIYVLVKRAIPADRQAMMYATLSAGWVLPSLLAPAFAGVMTEQFGWRWVFLGIVPLAVIVGVLASRPMMAYGPHPDGGDVVDGRLASAFGVSAGVGLMVICLRSSNPLVFFAGTAAGVALAVPMLRRLMPRGFFVARRGFPAVLACRVLATATFLGVDSFVPLAADRIHGATPMVQGFVIIGAALCWTAGQTIMARRPKFPPQRAVRIGFALLAGGTMLVAPVLWAGWPLWATFLAWPVGGLGMGILFNPTTIAAMSYADAGREGNTSSQVQLSDALGFSLMGGIGGAVVALADRTDLSLQSAIGINFALAIGCATIGFVAGRGVRNRALA